MLKNFFILLYLKAKFYILKFTRFKKNVNKYSKHGNINKNKIIESLKLHGYAIIDNYFTEDECNKIISRIDNYIKKNPQNVWKDKNSSDERIFGYNHVCETSKKFFLDSDLIEVFNKSSGYRNDCIFTLAGKIKFIKNGLGSGGSWHRDSINPSFKSMIYLTKVNEDNGPFEIIKKSNKFYEILKDINDMGFLDVKNTRFNEESVKKIRNFDKRVKTLTANKGSLLIFDGSYIHRGKPLNADQRYTLTNYYFPVGKMTQERYPVRPQVFSS